MIELKTSRCNDRRFEVTCKVGGRTEELLDELAAGAAHVIVGIVDELPAVDQLHESMARVVGSLILDQVVRILMDRDETTMTGQAEDRPADA